jgi:hypothetical protein
MLYLFMPLPGPPAQPTLHIISRLVCLISTMVRFVVVVSSDMNSNDFMHLRHCQTYFFALVCVAVIGLSVGGWVWVWMGVRARACVYV